MEEIRQTYIINAPLSRVWKALTSKDDIEKWGAGPNVEMSEEVNQEFKLWGGDVWGRNIKVKPEEELIQEWYGGKWAKPSKVTFRLSSKGEDKTVIELVHSDFPAKEKRDLNQGWKDYYLGPLKDYLEGK